MLHLHESLWNVCRGADGGENLVEHRAELDVAEFLLLVIAIHEIATAVALSELGLDIEALHLDGLGSNGLEEYVV